MREVIAIFFFLGAVGFLVMPWEDENGRKIGWRTRIVLAVLCMLAVLGALFVNDPFD